MDYACALGLLTGYDDGAFHGEEKMTRAQAAAVLSRLLEAAPGQPGRVQTVQTGERSASTYSYASTKRWTGASGETPGPSRWTAYRIWSRAWPRPWTAIPGR